MIDKKNTLVTVLVLVIIGLVLFLGYAFVVQPAITGNIIEKQQEGYEYAYVEIMQGIIDSNCQPMPLTYYNSTINIIAIDCLQQQVPAQTELVE